jgi:hypothetical protein
MKWSGLLICFLVGALSARSQKMNDSLLFGVWIGTDTATTKSCWVLDSQHQVSMRSEFSGQVKILRGTWFTSLQRSLNRIDLQLEDESGATWTITYFFRITTSGQLEFQTPDFTRPDQWTNERRGQLTFYKK